MSPAHTSDRSAGDITFVVADALCIAIGEDVLDSADARPVPGGMEVLLTLSGPAQAVTVRLLCPFDAELHQQIDRIGEHLGLLKRHPSPSPPDGHPTGRAAVQAPTGASPLTEASEPADRPASPEEAVVAPPHRVAGPPLIDEPQWFVAWPLADTRALSYGELIVDEERR
jgi:hypothetical protein